LPLSWPKDVRDSPAYLNFGSTRGRVMYGEDVYVGYKYYDKVEREPLFAFGHGLSYTTFSLSSLTITTDIKTKQQTARIKVTNTGSCSGFEVLQLYISAPNSPTQRPKKELHGFEKVFLEPKQKKVVDIAIDKYAMSFWDEIEGKWCKEQGTYKVIVATSSATDAPRVEAELTVQKTEWWLGL